MMDGNLTIIGFLGYPLVDLTVLIWWGLGLFGCVFLDERFMECFN